MIEILIDVVVAVGKCCIGAVVVLFMHFTVVTILRREIDSRKAGGK